MELKLENLGTLLGEGSFAQVYALKNMPHLAVKIAKNPFVQLQKEVKVLLLMSQSNFFPKLIGFGTMSMSYSSYNTTEHQRSYIILQKLGISLQQLMMLRNQNLSISTIKKIGFQLLAKIRLLHDKNILHNDIKPSNILFGLHEKRSSIFLIDYGLSHFLPSEVINNETQENNQLIDDTNGNSFIFRGSLLFSSLGKLKGKVQTKLDDVQSLMYVVLWMLEGGRLYWQNSDDNTDNHGYSISNDIIMLQIRKMILKKQEYLQNNIYESYKNMDRQKDELIKKIILQLKGISSYQSPSLSVRKIYDSLQSILQ